MADGRNLRPWHRALRRSRRAGHPRWEVARRTAVRTVRLVVPPAIQILKGEVLRGADTRAVDITALKDADIAARVRHSTCANQSWGRVPTATRMAGAAAIPATVVEGLPATVVAATAAAIRHPAAMVAADRHMAVAADRTEAATAKRYSGACAKCEAPKRCLSSQVGRITFRVPLFLRAETHLSRRNSVGDLRALGEEVVPALFGGGE